MALHIERDASPDYLPVDSRPCGRRLLAAASASARGAAYKLNGPLIPARVTMVAAWDVPRNPLTDKALDESRLSKEVKWGYRIFTDTPHEAARFTGGRISCSNCHLNAGQREKSLPLVGIAGQFPEYNRRAGRFISLEDRIVDCFLRSENATGRGEAAELPTTGAKEVLAVAAYLAWLSQGSEMGKPPSWRGQNTIPTAAIVPVEKLDVRPRRGDVHRTLHLVPRADGQGVFIGDKRAAPLWGPDSWNDGAGAARVYTLAGIIRFTMPYLDPGGLTRSRSAGSRGVHQLESAAGISVQGSRLPDRTAAARQRLLSPVRGRRIDDVMARVARLNASQPSAQYVGRWA